MNPSKGIETKAYWEHKCSLCHKAIVALGKPTSGWACSACESRSHPKYRRIKHLEFDTPRLIEEVKKECLPSLRGTVAGAYMMLILDRLEDEHVRLEWALGILKERQEKHKNDKAINKDGTERGCTRQ